MRVQYGHVVCLHCATRENAQFAEYGFARVARQRQVVSAKRRELLFKEASRESRAATYVFDGDVVDESGHEYVPPAASHQRGVR